MPKEAVAIDRSKETSMLKGLKYFLLKWDGIWSLPIIITTFILAQIFGQFFYGDAFAPYDPALLQAGLMSLILCAAFNTAVLLALWFNFRGIYRYYINKSSSDFQTLTPCQKISFFFLVYFGLFASLVALTIALV